MTVFTRQHRVFQESSTPSEQYPFSTTGTVVDTNDPQQMGRIRAVCPMLGDSMQALVEDIPWAVYVTPFGGQTSVGTRGPGIQTSTGGISYGMWAIPKVGALVIVMCLDGDPQHRAYVGCVYDQHTPHTLPHGRWMYEDHPALEKGATNPIPLGPYTSRESFIEPLNGNMRQAFGNKDNPNHEWRTRAADYQVAAVDIDLINQVFGSVPDDKDVTYEDWMSTQGYQISRTDPFAPTSFTDKNYDSMVYSWTSPGFHAISMDDRQENCRLRLRTTSGHQIILDDTNERIYIATAKGNNWIELDQDGNISMFTTNKVSVRAQKDINFTSDESIRFHAAKGIHMYSGTTVNIQSAQNMMFETAQSFYLQAAAAIHEKAGGVLNLTSSSTINILAATSILETAGAIHFNGPAAASATAPPEKAKWTNLVPDHEPYARVMTKDDYSHVPELPYTSTSVGRVERGRTISRGRYWRR